MQNNLAHKYDRLFDPTEYALERFGEEAKHAIREELMNDKTFAAECAPQSLADMDCLLYIAKAGRGEHDTVAARKIVANGTMFGELCPEELYVIEAAKGYHDTAAAAKLKAEIVEATVDAKWKELALTLSDAERIYGTEDL